MLSISCPHCHEALTDPELKRLFAQRNAKRRWESQAKKPAKPALPWKHQRKGFSDSCVNAGLSGKRLKHSRAILLFRPLEMKALPRDITAKVKAI